MTTTRSFARFAGILALIAAPLSWLSLVVGLLAVGGDFDTFGDTARLLSLGEPAATQLQWSYWLSSFGSYFLLLPLMLWLYEQFTERDRLSARWYALCGTGYLVLGGCGAAILASAWPELMRAYPTAGADQPTLVHLLELSTAIAEGGLQGLIQNVAGVVWWFGVGTILWPRRRAYAGLSLAIAAALLLTALGEMLATEVLTNFGLIATLLLVPIWALWSGVIAVRTTAALI